MVYFNSKLSCVENMLGIADNITEGCDKGRKGNLKPGSSDDSDSQVGIKLSQILADHFGGRFK
jgi:hypothetical protein